MSEMADTGTFVVTSGPFFGNSGAFLQLPVLIGFLILLFSIPPVFILVSWSEHEM